MSPTNQWGRQFTAKKTLWAVVILLAFLAGTETFCRFYLKLGDPPLFANDPEIGWISVPNKTYHRFGNLLHYNAYSMRSDDFPAHKTTTNEFRIMAIGDSVIYGGTRTDQSNLATDLIQRELAAKWNRKVQVGNISCNGWGPGNEWPYARRYGWFDADVVVYEIRCGSMHGPRFAPKTVAGVDPVFPDHKPLFAASELVYRYLPIVFPSLFRKGSNEGYHAPVDDPQVGAQNLADFKNVVGSAKAAGAKVLILLHWAPEELLQVETNKTWRPKGYSEIANVADQPGVQLLDMYNVEAQNRTFIYRDGVHLNDQGQRVMANVVEAALAEH